MERIVVYRGDITQLEVDAIVNAAKNSLRGGGGVDGAIHAAGGPAILNECMQWVEANGPLKTGEAMITSGGKMPCKFVIHTVGPVWQGGEKEEAELLRNAYWNSLSLAKSKEIKSIAFPNISTGVYGYPKEQAAAVAIETVLDWVDFYSQPERIIFVCFDHENEALYNKFLSSNLL